MGCRKEEKICALAFFFPAALRKKTPIGRLLVPAHGFLVMEAASDCCDDEGCDYSTFSQREKRKNQREDQEVPVRSDR
jgi:hypothetical protein